MPSKTLLDYITTEQKKGISEAAIRTQCLGAGWPTAMIDEAFAYLKSIESGPGSPTAVSLKKRSKLLGFISLGFNILSLLYAAKIVMLAGTVVIMQRALVKNVDGSLSFEFLTYNGWFYPVVFGLSFIASYLAITTSFMLPLRTKSVWNKAVISLICILFIELVIQYLSIQFILPINHLSNSY